MFTFFYNWQLEDGILSSYCNTILLIIKRHFAFMLNYVYEKEIIICTFCFSVIWEC